MSVLRSVFGSWRIGVVRHPSVGQQLLQVGAGVGQVRRAIRPPGRVVAGDDLIALEELRVEDVALRDRRPELGGRERLPLGLASEHGQHEHEPTVIRTIHNVGVRAIFRNGLSGWLSWGSWEWSETVRAPARCARRPVAHGSTGRSQRWSVIGSRCRPRGCTCVYAPVTTCTVCGTGVGGPLPPGVIATTIVRARTKVKREPTLLVGRHARRGTVRRRRLHVALERAIGAGARQALDGAGRAELDDTADPRARRS